MAPTLTCGLILLAVLAVLAVQAPAAGTDCSGTGDGRGALRRSQTTTSGRSRRPIRALVEKFCTSCREMDRFLLLLLSSSSPGDFSALRIGFGEGDLVPGHLTILAVFPGRNLIGCRAVSQRPISQIASPLTISDCLRHDDDDDDDVEIRSFDRFRPAERHLRNSHSSSSSSSSVAPPHRPTDEEDLSFRIYAHRVEPATPPTSAPSSATIRFRTHWHDVQSAIAALAGNPSPDALDAILPVYGRYGAVCAGLQRTLDALARLYAAVVVHALDEAVDHQLYRITRVLRYDLAFYDWSRIHGACRAAARARIRAEIRGRGQHAATPAPDPDYARILADAGLPEQDPVAVRLFDVRRKRWPCRPVRLDISEITLAAIACMDPIYQSGQPLPSSEGTDADAADDDDDVFDLDRIAISAPDDDSPFYDDLLVLYDQVRAKLSSSPYEPDTRFQSIYKVGWPGYRRRRSRRPPISLTAIRPPSAQVPACLEPYGDDRLRALLSDVQGQPDPQASLAVLNQALERGLYAQYEQLAQQAVAERQLLVMLAGVQRRLTLAWAGAVLSDLIISAFGGVPPRSHNGVLFLRTQSMAVRVVDDVLSGARWVRAPAALPGPQPWMMPALRYEVDAESGAYRWLAATIPLALCAEEGYDRAVRDLAGQPGLHDQPGAGAGPEQANEDGNGGGHVDRAPGQSDNGLQPEQGPDRDRDPDPSTAPPSPGHRGAADDPVPVPPTVCA